jgi:mercuric ion transport protein
MAELQRAAASGRPLRDVGGVLLTVGGLGTAFGAASCCGLPFLLATAGLSTAWLGGFALLAAPHRVFLLVAATLCLAVAAALLWRQRVAVCAPGSVCSRPAVRRLTVAGLLAGLALLYLGYSYA